jgi:dihydrofolate synthase/folylpolyglutamate synthase
MKYDDAINYLYALQKHGIKLGLENTVRLLSLLGNPQDSFASVHLAGTNGKGSTSSMIAAVLRASGLKVGVFTSPHLVSFTERIRVDGIEITEKEVVELTQEIRETIQHTSHNTQHPFLPTFFEFVTAMAFLYFRRKGAQWAVVETGMGGRLDATNILVPRVSVITRIGHDHREFLGETLADIAFEKAGIIKEGIPVVSSAQAPEALKVLTATAARKGAALFLHGREFSLHGVEGDMGGVSFTYEGLRRFENLHVPLCGLHQAENGAVAVKTAELLMETCPVQERAIREGLAGVAWPGRLELIRREGKKHDLLIDGAHNPDAAQALADALERYFVPAYGKVVLVLGIMADKDIEGIMRPLLKVAREIILTAPDYTRAASPDQLAAVARASGSEPVTAPSLKEAMNLAIRKAEAGSPPAARSLVVITGSFYTIGEAKTLLGHEGVLTRLRE